MGEYQIENRDQFLTFLLSETQELGIVATKVKHH
jgi:hypothetical protein